MGVGLAISLLLLIMNLFFLLFVFHAIDYSAFNVEFIIILITMIATLLMMFLIKKKRCFLKTTLLFFSFNLLHVAYLYFQTKTYSLIGLAIVNVCGLLYTIEIIVPEKTRVQKRIHDFHPKEKKKMINRELQGQPEKDPKIVIIREENKEKDMLIKKAIVKVAGKKKKIFIGSTHSKKVHHPSCRYIKNISYKNKVEFKKLPNAYRQGYKKCVCLRK
ncbi:MAG: hypothetical protein KKF44_05675 [Nanoarchaeota archaeon]|nr:hypothetical protein [Nanoarchaeota archaeon]